MVIINTDWVWVPLVSVGPMVFGQDAQALIKEYGLVLKEPTSEICDWDTYEFPEIENQVYVVDGKISSIGCFTCIEYQEHNLIGATLDEITGLLGKPDIIGAKDDVGGCPVDYEALGLTVFIVSGRVISAFAEGPDED